jgi:hypothetical protein
MKISQYVSVKLVMIAIACSFAASTSIQAREARAVSASGSSGNNARLVVTRAPNFGTLEFVNLFVDGVQVADLGYNQTYDAILRPGQHVISMTTNPDIDVNTPSPIYVSARPGQTMHLPPFGKMLRMFRWNNEHGCCRRSRSSVT